MAVVLSTPAYLKIMLHAAKHPHCPVNGLLLGQGSAAETLSVSDAVPLFHQHTLSPMLEAATTLAEQYCVERGDGLKIVGYYHANERANDREVSQLVRQVHAKVNENFAGAVLLMVDNEQLADAGSLALRCQWKGADGSEGLFGCDDKLRLADDGAKDALTQYLADGSATDGVYDFDEHFFNVSCDWRNPHIK